MSGEQSTRADTPTPEQGETRAGKIIPPEIHPKDAYLMRLCLEDIAENCPDSGWAEQAREALPTREPAPTEQGEEGGEARVEAVAKWLHEFTRNPLHDPTWEKLHPKAREVLHPRARDLLRVIDDV